MRAGAHEDRGLGLALSDAAPRTSPAAPRRGGLRLRPLRLTDEAAALAAHRELARDRFHFLLAYLEGESWPGYLRRLDELRGESAVSRHGVPATFLVADVDGELVGGVSIRHSLATAVLRNFVGHIGYGVRPASRRRGYATQILGHALIVARSIGIDPVLVTCAEENVASARVIEHHGGVLEDVRVDPDGTPRRRYWIG